MTKRQGMIGVEVPVDLTDEEIRKINKIAKTKDMSFKTSRSHALRHRHNRVSPCFNEKTDQKIITEGG